MARQSWKRGGAFMSRGAIDEAGAVERLEQAGALQVGRNDVGHLEREARVVALELGDGDRDGLQVAA